jgi:SAM-dependent methyltransferase
MQLEHAGSLDGLLTPRAPDSPFQRDRARRRDETRARFDALAPTRDAWRARARAYHDEVTRLVRTHVPPGAAVLEVGCGAGELLAALAPSRGVGVDVSPGMLERARARHPGLRFVQADAEELDLGGETFDFVVLSDVLAYVEDVWLVFRRLQRVCHPGTRLVVTTHSALWEPALGAAERLGLKSPSRPTSWLGHEDLAGLLHLNHFEVVTQGSACLLPVRAPGLAPLANRVLAQLPGLRALNLVLWLVARPAWLDAPPAPRPLSVSVIVPTRDERGNVADIFDRTPDMGLGTDLVFVDGRSTDGTVEEVERRLGTRPAVLLRQTGKGKGDAVRLGLDAARGDVVMILDSDLTVPPEDLPKFYLALAEGRGELINGTRLVYPLEDEAMRFLNKLGNKFFSVALSAVLGQQLKDTLCGTKALSRADWDRVRARRGDFGELDPFGDFDLLFGAARLDMKLAEVPVRYRARTYGVTKISRFSDGLRLLHMTWVGLRTLRLGL